MAGGRFRAWVPRGVALASALLSVGCGDTPAPSGGASRPRGVEAFACQRELGETLVFHRACVDEDSKLVPWSNAESPYADVADRAWAALEAVPSLPNGKPTYYTSALFAGAPPDVWAPGKGLPHHPAGVLAMFVDSALSYFAYSGDDRALRAVVLPFADHMLENGMTEATDAWANVPYSCADFGSLTYHGSSIGFESGDGYGYLEPDKVAEVGLAFLRLYEYGGDARYLDTAIACADALVAQRRAGDGERSPWPFRVDAATGEDVLEPWGTQISGALRLFSELARIDQGEPAAYRLAHDEVLAWALEQPFLTNDWQHYFEDVAATPVQNRNQYAPLEFARYLLEHPEVTPDAVAKAKQLIDWVAQVFGADFSNDDGNGGTLFEPGMQYGAEAISEQELDTAKMGSHTARFASLLALYHEKTGDLGARSRAFRSFNWASYCESADGIVNVGPNPREGFWFSDGYGDYIRHFMAGLGAVPEWAPASENHLVRSSSVTQTVTLTPSALSYETFDAVARDVLRLAASPARIELDGLAAKPGSGDDHFVVEAVETGGVVITLRRAHASTVRVVF